MTDFNTPWEYDHTFRAIFDASGTTVTFLPTRHDPARARLLLAAPELWVLVRRILLQPKSSHDKVWVERARALIAEIEGGGT